MAKNDTGQATRRNFLGSLATGAAALGIATFASPLRVNGETENPFEIPGDTNPDEMFKKIKGKHKVVFDVTEPHGVFPFAWARVFLVTNAMTGTPEKENSVVVVLRHDAIPFAMEDRLWEKYKFGELFKFDDPKTKAPSVRNPFWQPKPGDFQIPGLGNVAIGINELQDSGVMFCVCNMAMTVYSAVAAMNMNMDAAAVKKDWDAGILPNIQPVPSGVWAVGRAQEKGCGYVFVG
jgi:intracellular sulfur oxidation DsrE/DsrF family protein